MKKHITVKDLPISERPYEKCEKFGPEALSDAELLAAIIRSGTATEKAVDVGINLLKLSPGENLTGLCHLTSAQMQTVSGIGKIKAVQIRCALELAKRLTQSMQEEKTYFHTPDSIAKYYMQELRNLETEHVLLLNLGAKNQLCNKIVLSSGTVNASFCMPRDIFLAALKHHAVKIVLLHNHPSGDPTPSKGDIDNTKQIAEIGDFLGIPLIDHIIIGDNTYVSLREAGFLDPECRVPENIVATLRQDGGDYVS